MAYLLVFYYLGIQILSLFLQQAYVYGMSVPSAIGIPHKVYICSVTENISEEGFQGRYEKLFISLLFPSDANTTTDRVHFKGLARARLFSERKMYKLDQALVLVLLQRQALHESNEKYLKLTNTS